MYTAWFRRADSPPPSALDSPKYAFFLPVDVLSSVFRAKFVDGLRKAFQKGSSFFRLRAQLATRGDLPFLSIHFQATVGRNTPSRHFGAPTHVLRYLGRYTHRVAISNHRLLAFDGVQVTFRWKDYAHGNKQKK